MAREGAGFSRARLRTGFGEAADPIPIVLDVTAISFGYLLYIYLCINNLRQYYILFREY